MSKKVVFLAVIISLLSTAARSDGWISSMQEKMSGYFATANTMTEDQLSFLLSDMLYYVIEGVSTSPPEALSGWIPPLEVESTISRRNRYLREYEGDQNKATDAAIARNHSTIRRLKIAAANVVPFLGMPTSYSISLWLELREIALIAAIHGHDLHDPEVQMKILSATVGGNLLKIPSATLDLAAREVVKKILIQIGLGGVSSAAIPAHLIFNYFTDNAAKVATHAKELFAGENSRPVPMEKYFSDEFLATVIK